MSPCLQLGSASPLGGYLGGELRPSPVSVPKRSPLDGCSVVLRCLDQAPRGGSSSRFDARSLRGGIEPQLLDAVPFPFVPRSLDSCTFELLLQLATSGTGCAERFDQRCGIAAMYAEEASSQPVDAVFGFRGGARWTRVVPLPRAGSLERASRAVELVLELATLPPFAIEFTSDPMDACRALVQHPVDGVRFVAEQQAALERGASIVHRTAVSAIRRTYRASARVRVCE